MSGFTPHTLSLLAKGAPVSGPLGPTPDEVLMFFGILGASLLVWSLISAALFRAALATYNRFAAEEDQTAQVSFGRALLVGFVYIGSMIVVLSVLFIGLGIVFNLLMGTTGTPRNAMLISIWQAVSWISTMLSGWLVKSLLSTAFVPCGFTSASHVGVIWGLYEMLVFVLMLGTMYLAVYLTGGWPNTWWM